ncbi:condensation domain-containing protein, partial [Paenibacillus sp. 598K]|uniref:condensation domain-containing protein n=1 Tax=Paenibacillus sp. 598K TaxID=1117987 RepID=UPI0021AA16FE
TAVERDEAGSNHADRDDAACHNSDRDGADSHNAERDAATAAALADWVRSFDLEQAPLLRAGLLRLSEEKHLLLLDMHHSIGDALTTQLLLSELAAAYEGRQLPAPSFDYKDYAAWQRSWRASEAARRQRDYWSRQLGGELPVLELPTDRRRPAVQTFAGDRVAFATNEGLMQQLQELARQHGCTLFMVLLAAYATLLSRYAGAEELTVGTPAAGRTHPQTTDMPGLFVNTLVLRMRPRQELPYARFLETVRETAIAAYEHQDMPFEELVELLDMRRDPSRNPLFDTMFLMQQEETGALRLGEATLTSVPLPYRVSAFDLTLSADETAEGLRFELEYNTDLFDASTIRRMAGHYMQLLASIVAAPEEQLGRLSMLSAAELHQLTSELAVHRQLSATESVERATADGALAGAVDQPDDGVPTRAVDQADDGASKRSFNVPADQPVSAATAGERLLPSTWPTDG